MTKLKIALSVLGILFMGLFSAYKLYFAITMGSIVGRNSHTHPINESPLFFWFYVLLCLFLLIISVLSIIAFAVVYFKQPNPSFKRDA